MSYRKEKSKSLLGIDTNNLKKDSLIKLSQSVLNNGMHGLCFSPYEDRTAAGVKTRAGSPYFLINIMSSTDLGKAHQSIVKTKYFDNFTKQELIDIKIYGKNTKKALDINKNN